MQLLITYDIHDLQTISLYDGTEDISDINGVRFLFETVNSSNNPQAATTCTAWTEYEVLSGTAVANGVSYTTGSKMLFANDTTPTGTYTMQTTGRYGQYVSDILPRESDGWSFTPSQTGNTAFNTLYFNDEIFTITAYYYNTKVASGGTLTSGKNYLVVNKNDSSQNIVVSGTKVLYVGEVYTAIGSETIVSGSSDTYMVEYSDEGQFSFATLYQSFGVWQAYLEAKALEVNPSQILDSNLLMVATLFASPQIAAQTTQGIDLQGLQNNIDRILNFYAHQI